MSYKLYYVEQNTVDSLSSDPSFMLGRIRDLPEYGMSTRRLPSHFHHRCHHLRLIPRHNVVSYYDLESEDYLRVSQIRLPV